MISINVIQFYTAVSKPLMMTAESTLSKRPVLKVFPTFTCCYRHNIKTKRKKISQHEIFCCSFSLLMFCCRMTTMGRNKCRPTVCHQYSLNTARTEGLVVADLLLEGQL